MEGLKGLCECCKNQHCKKNEIIIIDNNEFVTIQCLQFKKDESKIKPPDKFIYIIRSDAI